MPSVSSVDERRVLVEDAHDDAPRRARSGSVTTRTSTRRPSTVSDDAAVLRHAALGDVEVGHDLDARDDAGDHPARDRRRRRAARRRCGSARACSRPSGSKWMSEAPSLDRLGDDRVHELDDRRVVGRLAQVGDLGRASSSSSSSTASATASSRRFRRAISAAMSSREATTGAHLVAGHHRDVVDREHVRRVGHRDAAACARRRSRSARPRSAWRPAARSGSRAPMSTLKTARSTWSRPKRSAVARASWSAVIAPCSSSICSGGAAAASGRSSTAASTRSRVGEAELDDHVGQEAARAAAAAAAA